MNLRSRKQWLAGVSAGFFGCVVFATIFVLRLDSPREGSIAPAAAFITANKVEHYFDDSFVKYFGREGVAAAERVLASGIDDPQALQKEISNHRARTLRLEPQ